MEFVEIKGKKFKVSISAAKIKKRVQVVGTEISKDLAGKQPIFIIVLNGAFMFAADLIREVKIPCELNFIRYSSYEGMKSTGKVKEIIGLNVDIENRPVVIVEDIIDSGLTMQHLIAELNKKNPSEIHIASLLVKRGNMKVGLNIEYPCFEIPNDFILGYGLDFDGLARNLKDIYTIV